MPDFNKGDFTQQGVNGHVNATVRLNEKRLLNIDLTSNEEAEGCTITGTVKDLLNDKVYNIGSGGGGGDFTIAEITITNPSTENSSETYGSFVFEADELGGGSPATLYYSYLASASSTKTLKIALYKGNAIIQNSDIADWDHISGNITPLAPGIYNVTGDCSITTKE